MKKQKMPLLVVGVLLLGIALTVGVFMIGANKNQFAEETEKIEPQPLQIETVQEKSNMEENTSEKTKEEEPEDVKEEEPEEQEGAEPIVAKKKVALDAGHQRRGMSEHEPIGPGAQQTKPKVSSGTRGVATGIYEYELNLTVTLLLEAELQARGYEVVMIRSIHDVEISNAQRAVVANEANADAFLRIHANGSENSATRGALAMCMTPSNPYNGQLYEASRRLSDTILGEFCKVTGAPKLNVIEIDTMSGINWCNVPVTIIEMGFMSNAEEDKLLNTADYQMKMVQGIANGLDAYFGY